MEITELDNLYNAICEALGAFHLSLQDFYVEFGANDLIATSLNGINDIEENISESYHKLLAEQEWIK